VFDGLAPVGISMFYMSTIVSQFVFSGGGSKFGNAIGSEMVCSLVWL
jgi:SulP family sulfate permease